jgi:hypothetical protein
MKELFGGDRVTIGRTFELAFQPQHLTPSL